MGAAPPHAEPGNHDPAAVKISLPGRLRQVGNKRNAALVA
jgi:hypothetical protein